MLAARVEEGELERAAGGQVELGVRASRRPPGRRPARRRRRRPRAPSSAGASRSASAADAPSTVSPVTYSRGTPSPQPTLPSASASAHEDVRRRRALGERVAEREAEGQLHGQDVDVGDERHARRVPAGRSAAAVEPVGEVVPVSSGDRPRSRGCARTPGRGRTPCRARPAGRTTRARCPRSMIRSSPACWSEQRQPQRRSAASSCRSQIAVSKKKRAVTSRRLSGSLRMKSRYLRVAGEELGLERDGDRPVLVDEAADPDLELVLRRQVDLRLQRRADEREPRELLLRPERVARPRAARPSSRRRRMPGAPSSSRLASSTKLRDVVDELPVRPEVASRPLADARAAPVRRGRRCTRAGRARPPCRRTRRRGSGSRAGRRGCRAAPPARPGSSGTAAPRRRSLRASGSCRSR